MLLLVGAWAFYLWLLYEVLQTVVGLCYWILEVADFGGRQA